MSSLTSGLVSRIVARKPLPSSASESPATVPLLLLDESQQRHLPPHPSSSATATVSQPSHHAQSSVSTAADQHFSASSRFSDQPKSPSVSVSTEFPEPSSPAPVVPSATSATRQAQAVGKNGSTTINVPLVSATDDAAKAVAYTQRYSRWQVFRGRFASNGTWKKKFRRKQTSNHQASHNGHLQSQKLALHAPDWISGWLHPASLLLFLTVSASACIGLVVLMARSHSHGGIATIGDDTPLHVTADIQLYKSLLWTFLPTLVVQIYSLCFKATISALKERQPYIALREAGDDGVSANKSILLNYAKQIEVVTVFHALKNHHILISVACLLSLLLAIVGTPAASHLLVIRDNIETSRGTSLTQRVFYDENGIDGKTDLKTILNYVTSIQLYNASHPLWTKDEYSFPPLDVPSAAEMAGGNFSLSTHASQLLPDCRVLEEGSEWTITTSGTDEWEVFANDGMCNVTNYFANNGDFEYYSQTYVKSDCPLMSGSNPGRILLFFAQLDDEKDFVTRALISCTTEYVNSTGQLNMSFSPSVLIHSFQVQSSDVTYPRPNFWQVFEAGLAGISTSDDTATYSTTDMGRLVLDYVVAMSNSSTNTTVSPMPIDPALLATGLQTNLATAYAIAAEAHLYSALPDGASDIHHPAIQYTYNTRLVVVDRIAGLLLGFLALASLIILAVLIHTLSHTSILREEPQGLLGSAILTYNSSDIHEVAADLRSRCKDGKCVAEYDRKPNVKKGTDNKYRDWSWKAEDTDSVSGLRIVAIQKT